jgi:exodeoxyribonuclease VII small subunit
VTDRESISYEQARDELAAVVRRLEAGGLTLEQSLDLWERGEKLAAVCAEWLDGARARLTTAMAARDSTDAGGAGGTGRAGNTAKNDGPDAQDAPF